METEPVPETLRETLRLFDPSGPPLTTAEVAADLDLGRRAAYNRLERLLDRGRLRSKKAGSGGRVWWQPGPDAEPCGAGERAGADDRARKLARYDTLFREARDVNAVVDTDGRFQTITPSVANVLGYDREHLLGEVGFEYIHPADREHATAEFDEMLADPDYEPTLEFRFEHDDGSWVHLEAHARNLVDDPDIEGIVVYTRDVTDRKAREATLERQINQQEVVNTLRQQALDGEPLDDLLAEAAERVASVLDNDYCKVLDLDAEAEQLLLRQGVGWQDGTVGNATVSAVADDSQAAYTLSTSDPVVVEDLRAEPRFSGPPLLTTHDVRSGISVIIGTPDDPWGILGTHDTETATFSTYDVNFVQSVANVIADAVDRASYERQRRRHTNRLAALNELNSVAREITATVIDRQTRADIEQTVCDHLAAADSYTFAWVGAVDVASETVTLRAEAGVEGYLDGIDITVDPDDARSQGPTGRALRTGEVHVTRDTRTDDAHDPWREHVDEYGFRSSAAVPIVHDDSLYGVLNIYTERPGAFEDQELEVVRQLGEVIGHAIAATERKQALMNDEVIELAFQVPAVSESLELDAAIAGPLELNHAIPLDNGDFLVYGTVPADEVASVRRIADALSHWEAVTVHDGGDRDPRRFEAALSEPPVLATLASVGGSVEHAVIEDDEFHLTLHLSPGADVRRVIDTVRESYESAELLKRQQIERRQTAARPGDGRAGDGQELSEALTDRQQAALQAAYHAGFFEWPRDVTGEEIADSLGVAPPTFHQHLRKAERKVLAAVLSTGSSLG